MDDLMLYVFRVGHGLCTLIHGHDGDKPFNAIIDCGRSSYCLGFDENKYNLNTDKTLEEIKRIIKSDESACLDLLVSSHQDEDHNNMILDLICILNDQAFFTKFGYWIRDENCIRCISNFADKKLTKGTVEQEDVYIYTYNLELENKRRDITEIVPIDNLSRQCVSYEYSYVGTYFRLDLPFRFDLKFNAIRDENTFHDVKFKFKITYDGCFIYSEYEKEKVEEDLDAHIISKVSHDLGTEALCDLLNIEDSVVISGASRYYHKVLRDELDNALEYQHYKVYSGKSLSGLDKGYGLYSKPTFKIKNILVGGYSEGEEYLNLYGFLRNYRSLVAEASGMFYREKAYAFYEYYTDNGLYKPKPYESTDNEDTELMKVLCEPRNASSSCLGILYNETSSVINFVNVNDNERIAVLFPGDVTFHHQLDISNRMSDVNKVRVVIVPHHGSAHTNVLYTYVDEDPALFEKQPFREMYQKIYNISGGITSIISECYNCSKHELPRSECIVMMLPFSGACTLTECSLNYYWFNGKKNEFYEDTKYENKMSIYSTGYSKNENDLGFCIDLNTLEIEKVVFNHSENTAKKRVSEIPAHERVLPPDELFV